MAETTGQKVKFFKTFHFQKKLAKKLKLLLAILLFPVFSFAWNGEGHSTGGAIAYYYLKADSPGSIDKVLLALKSHPWYNLHGTMGWADRLAGLTSEQKRVQLFMLASTFPDEARNTPYDHPTWHYINYAFVPAGQTVQPTQSPAINAETKIIELQKTIKSEKDAVQKAIKICWLFHLIEDVHQPLHSTALFDSNHPSGDQGGNLTYIRFGMASAVKLHSYWDALIKTSIPNAPALAQSLLKKPEYKKSKLSELTIHTTPHQWIFLESFPLAKSNCYLNGVVRGIATAPTTVNNAYAGNASKVAERRIVLAGIRLAENLKAVLR